MELKCHGRLAALMFDIWLAFTPSNFNYSQFMPYPHFT